ncbi:hypothetical protein [Methylomonas sp. MgM2]
MKSRVNSFGLVCLVLTAACGSAGEINGHSLKTANKSVNFIKEHLSDDLRVEFEVAYWALRKQFKNDEEFLQAIDRKSAQDLIALAKADFAKQKAAGIKEYAAYDNWEEMLSQQIERRKLQDLTAIDTRDKKGYPRVDYKLHSM